MIYFIACREANAVKIGVTQDDAKTLHKRFEGIQGNCPLRLEILGIFPGYMDVEREFHERFAPSLIHGEWFRLTPELQEFCGMMLARVPPRPEPKLHATRKYRKWAEAA